KMAGIEPEDALFVGDSRNDVLAAKAAGVRCAALTYCFNHGRPSAPEAPTPVIDNLRDLLPVSYTHPRAHEKKGLLACRLLLGKKKKT
ncbi:HAD hydrolase-like protein, partial [Klebsiella variicola]|uniref:HAD hydrolase-like protein n=1 Tax=Klebsiella variicola TaxID=244366 RepID=UPI002730F79A